MKRCVERLEIATDTPEMVVPVLDTMGIKRYQIVDSGHVWIFDGIDQSPTINRELVQAGDCRQRGETLQRKTGKLLLKSDRRWQSC